MSNKIEVYRFSELVGDRPVELARAIVHTDGSDRGRLGEVLAEANDAVREALPAGHKIYLPVTSSEFNPVVIAPHCVQVTWVETRPLS